MINVEGFKNFLWEEELSPNTIQTYVSGIENFARSYSEISKPNLIAYKNDLIKSCRPKTVNLRITALLRYCRFAGSPLTLKHVKEQKQSHISNVITQQQLDKLLNGLRTDGNQRWVCYVLLLSKTGMRISEALRVTKKDLLHGSVTMNTKAHVRTIYFPQSLITELAPLIDKLSDNSPIMVNYRGKPLSRGGVRDALQVFSKRYGIPAEVMHPHSFRHFFAIEFLKRNNDISLLADILGHSSLTMTQLYLRRSREEQKKAVDDTVNW